MDPDYCQNPAPVYVMGASAVVMSLFYLLMAKMKAHKTSPAVYNHGFILFLIMGLAVCGRTFHANNDSPVVSLCAHRFAVHYAISTIAISCLVWFLGRKF